MKQKPNVAAKVFGTSFTLSVGCSPGRTIRRAAERRRRKEAKKQAKLSSEED